MTDSMIHLANQLILYYIWHYKMLQLIWGSAQRTDCGRCPITKATWAKHPHQWSGWDLHWLWRTTCPSGERCFICGQMFLIPVIISTAQMFLHPTSGVGEEERHHGVGDRWTEHRARPVHQQCPSWSCRVWDKGCCSWLWVCIILEQCT